ncbi:hypothetical protein SteCoe_38788 [Stentor coeruleus]|uniref:G-protein coupled receptors family 2 profile 2 domain-containing protein n=1 Tax=Stentor coeruleus TaxID=5963 RepID=A0A1R2ALA4_9CILI|nr:hypothetical protein SteCoe_38788 [Stentor coeruleus]
MSCSNQNILIGSYFLLASTLISLLCGILVMILCIKKTFIEDFTLKIIVYMTFNDIIRSLAMILVSFFNKVVIICQISAYIIETTFVSNIYWAISISTTLYRVIIVKDCDYKAFHKIWVFIAFVVVPVLQAIPFVTESYGINDNECAFGTGKIDNIWRLCLVYIPAWLSLLIMTLVYFKIKKIIGKITDSPAYDIIFIRGYIYSLIIGIIIIPFTILRILQAFMQNNCFLIDFSIVAECWLALHGVFNGIALCMNKKIRKGLFSKTVTTEDFLTSFEDISHDH